jgi:hypothetical protein
MPKISQYPSMTALAGSEIFVGDQTNVTSTATATQIATMAQGGFAAQDSGAVNAYVLTTSQPLPTLVKGQIVSFFPTNPNTGASTANLNGRGVVAIQDSAGNALTGGELVGPVILVWTGALWELLWSLPLPNKVSTAEVAAAILLSVPITTLVKNGSYPPLDVRRYGGDPLGVSDSTNPFTYLLAVMAQLGGASTTVWPGTYKVTTSITTNLTPSSGPNYETSGLTLYADGVVINYTGTGISFDFISPNTSALIHEPLLAIYGMKLIGTGTASGGFRVRSCSAVRWTNCVVQGFTAGPAWTMLNDTSWCENNHFRSCGAVNCATIIAFQRTGGTNSFSRTYVDGMFGAGITGPWFDIGGTVPGSGASNGCSVYDSRFTHISGNFVSTCLFAIGNSTNASDMTSTVIDGLDYEINASVANQCVMLLRDYPQNSGVARRPILTNIGAFATFNGSGQIPIWMSGAFAALPGPEVAQTQQFNIGSPLLSQWGQSVVYEPNFGVGTPATVSLAAGQRLVASYATPLDTVTMQPFAALSGRVIFNRVGSIVTMRAFDPLIGTSTGTTLTLSGIPAEFTPGATMTTQPLMIQNNGNATCIAYGSISTGGVITFSLQTAINTFSATGFTSGGVNGLTSGTTLTWSL